MTSFGIASHFARALSPVGLILRADGAPTILGPDVAAPIWFDVEEALRLGADALCVSAFPGHHTEMATLDNLASVAREAQAWGLAFQAEMVPGGMGGGPETRTVENVALAARVGWRPVGPASTRKTSWRTRSASTFWSVRMRAATPSLSPTRPSRMCSVPM